MKLPFSDEDIDRLIATPYVPPKPLTIPGILLLILFFPFGIYYLIRKNTPEYMLSLCETDEERDALFAYLKTDPEQYEFNRTNSMLKKHHLSKTFGIPYVGISSYKLYNKRRY